VVPGWQVPLKALLHVIAACVLLSKIVTTPAAHAQQYPESKNDITPGFNFRYFESRPKDRRVKEALAEVVRLCPPGSKAADFETYLTNSGAKCALGTEFSGPYLTCIYTIYGLFLVTTSWTASAYLDPQLSTIGAPKITRYLTGL
jgi:hypothetical protein